MGKAMNRKDAGGKDEKTMAANCVKGLGMCVMPEGVAPGGELVAKV